MPITRKMNLINVHFWTYLFKRAQIILSRRKKVVSMEANNIFKKKFKSLKIDKNNSQNLAEQKKL